MALRPVVRVDLRILRRPISDRGLWNGPADDERGHADGCARLAATIASWDAESAALDAAWQTGQ